MNSPVGRSELRADCSRCFGLCCVVLPFSASADFAITKPAGQACPHLQPDSRCEIHGELRPRGFPGCVAFDCFGAGQRLSQQTLGGVDWREAPPARVRMIELFPIMRTLHELLWYLTAALDRPEAQPLFGELRAMQDRIESLVELPGDAVAGIATDELVRAVDPLLARTSELVRASSPGARAPVRRADLAGADLPGADLRRADLRGADLRGALLIAADLRGVDLTDADLLGADLRNADLAGADLRTALFLTRMQVSSARGDATTRRPSGLERPAHWR